jgi:hypothetical protein
LKKIVFVFLLSACVPAQDVPGQVVQFNGDSVTIRGAGDYSLASVSKGQGFQPTAAMIAQANKVCPGARFMSGTPESPTGDSWAINYLFICP